METRLPNPKGEIKSSQSRVKTNITLLPDLKNKIEFAAFSETKRRGSHYSVSDFLSDCAEAYLKENYPDIEERMRAARIV